jgi:hypothetical protein
MYYHVCIEKKEKTKGNKKSSTDNQSKECFKFDILERKTIIDKILIPYRLGKEFQFSGYCLTKEDIERILIKQSEKKYTEIKEMIKEEAHKAGITILCSIDSEIFKKDLNADITSEVFAEAEVSAEAFEKNNCIDNTSQAVKTNNNTLPKKYFISHSEKDKDLAIEITSMIEAMGASQSDIFCSSITGYDTKIGEPWRDDLKARINDKTFMFFLLSENFYSSHMCLCELGAAWILTKNHARILVPTMTREKIKDIMSDSQDFYINEATKWTQLREQLGFIEGNAIWEGKRDGILKRLEPLLKSLEVC